jgi:phosphatidylglycerol:prolipoprotein diacylglycerol transferase
MWPTTFGIRTYGVFYALSMVTLGAMACWHCRRMKVPLRTGVLLGLCYIFGMTIGAKILYDLLHGSVHWQSYFDIHHYLKGGLWGGPLAYLAIAVPAVLLFARDRRTLLDLVVLALPVPMILAKVGCLCNGCCYGVPCDLPWAVAYVAGAEAPAGVLRHPTPIYEILVLLTILLVFALLDRRRWKGTLLLWFVMIYGIGRPLTEVFRGDGPRVPDVGPLTASQAVCLAAALVSLGVLVVLSRTTSSPRALEATN